MENQPQGGGGKRGSTDPREMFLGAQMVKEQAQGGGKEQGSLASNESIEIDVNNKMSRPG